MRNAASSFLLAAALACVPLCSTAAGASAHQRLHVEQQQHALELQLRQSAGARRHALSPSDAHRLRQLELEQRLDQQQLELQQLQRERAQTRNPGALPPHVLERRIDAQREVFARERELQIQRFDLERSRLLQSLPREPLQPAPGSPRSDLR